MQVVKILQEETTNRLKLLSTFLVWLHDLIDSIPHINCSLYLQSKEYTAQHDHSHQDRSSGRLQSNRSPICKKDAVECESVHKW